MMMACEEKKGISQEGAYALLQESRMALEKGDYVAAKACIDSMRAKFPTALNAREDGIILLDSINIAESKVELQVMEDEIQKIVNPDRFVKDSIDIAHDEAIQKVKFFERKLQHDIKNKAKH